MSAHITFPTPLQPGNTIGVTAPSAGVGSELEARLQFCLQASRNLGYNLQEGHCLRSEAITSAPPQDRAAELMAMLLDDTIQAVIPPWGGEILIDILPLLDFKRLAQARPKWILGYSDLTTLMLPYTLLTGIATAHGSNLMEAPIRFGTEPIAYWHDILTLPPGRSFTQGAASHYQIQREDWAEVPTVTAFNCTEPGEWKWLKHEADADANVSVSGRLIGGCLDVISMLPGTPYGAMTTFARTYAPEGLLVYLENVDGAADQACRMYHHIKLAGWLDDATALLIGRSAGPDWGEFTHRDALLNAFDDLNIPIIYDMDIGHVPPQMMLVNGAQATLTFGHQVKSVQQTLR